MIQPFDTFPLSILFWLQFPWGHQFPYGYHGFCVDRIEHNLNISFLCRLCKWSQAYVNVACRVLLQQPIAIDLCVVSFSDIIGIMLVVDNALSTIAKAIIIIAIVRVIPFAIIWLWEEFSQLISEVRNSLGIPRLMFCECNVYYIHVN